MRSFLKEIRREGHSADYDRNAVPKERVLVVVRRLRSAWSEDHPETCPLQRAFAASEGVERRKVVLAESEAVFTDSGQERQDGLGHRSRDRERRPRFRLRTKRPRSGWTNGCRPKR